MKETALRRGGCTRAFSPAMRPRVAAAPVSATRHLLNRLHQFDRDAIGSANVHDPRSGPWTLGHDLRNSQRIPTALTHTMQDGLEVIHKKGNMRSPDITRTCLHLRAIRRPCVLQQLNDVATAPHH